MEATHAEDGPPAPVRARAPRPRRGVVLAALAVAAAVATAALLVARYAIPVGDNSRPLPGPKPTSAFDRELVVLTDVRVRPGARPGDPPLVALGLPGQPAIDNRAANPSLLGRELFRQALLLAARDALGAVTRDALLGEDAPADGREAELQLGIVVDLNDSAARVAIRRKAPGGAAGKVLLEERFRIPMNQTLGVAGPSLIEAAEALSRSGFPEVLAQEAGVQAAPPRSSRGGGVPDGVEGRLATLTFPEQYAALRALHAAVREAGESPERLGALARGYANLGVLTELHWGPEHVAWKARGLLYAQRMMVVRPGSPEGRRHRAYALAMAGRYGEALADLEAARRDAPGGGPEPPWAALIAASGRFEPKVLEAVPASAPEGPLARLLAFRMAEHASQTTRRGVGAITTAALVRAGRAAAEVAPECYRVHDSLAEAGGVAFRHESTLRGVSLFAEKLPGRIAALPGVPVGVAAAASRRGDLPGLMRALAEAGAVDSDRGEPSWAALGRTALEARFVQVASRARFMHELWGVPTGEFLPAARREVAAHPLAPYLDIYADGPAGAAALQRLRTLEVRDIEMHQLELARHLRVVDEARAQAQYNRAYRYGDMSERDMMMRLTEYQVGDSGPLLAGFVVRLNPLDPFGKVAIIERDWRYAREHAKEWEDDPGVFPSVLGALGRAYAAEGRAEDAVRCLRRAVQASPDAENVRALAEQYRASGDEERWKETLLSLLDMEDLGLEHARACADLAEYHMARREWEAARPYAEAAGASWSAWGMDCAARCCEGLGDMKGAERWVRRRAERYPDAASLWLLWCIRHARGDASAAAGLALDALEARPGPLSEADRDLLSCGAILAHRPGPALERLRDEVPKPGHDAAGMMLALLADEAGDTTLRDARWADPGTSDAAFRALSELFRASVAAEGDQAGRLDPAAIDPICEGATARRRGDILFLAGRFLQIRGHREQAAALLERCAEGPDTKGWVRLAAWDALTRDRDGRPVRAAAGGRRAE